MPAYDAIVIGVGGVGGAALLALARRGARVLGLDRFPPGHDRGSSHGQTRIIRQAYFEHPDYVPLVLRAYELWRELSEESGERLFDETGLLQVGPADGKVIQGVWRAAEEHGLAIERLTPEERRRRFPQFHATEESAAVFEARAGVLMVERCVLAHVAQARTRGAETNIPTTVLGWRAAGSAIEVQTDRGRHSAERLIVAAGPWAASLLAGLNAPLVVRRKHLHWRAAGPEFDHTRCPAFLYETAQGFFYGFPSYDALGVKAAEHSGGQSVEDPLTASREPDARDTARVEAFLREHLPGVSGRATSHATCFYTMSPDEHFLVGPHPAEPRVLLAAGLSGHGFKFTTVLGEALADLALDGRTDLPIGFLSPERFA